MAFHITKKIEGIIVKLKLITKDWEEFKIEGFLKI